MRSAGQLHPEWGYLAPALDAMRTARLVLVATAVGATAGAAVVLSLVDHPAGETGNASASRGLVGSVEAASPPVIITAPVQHAAPAAVAAPVAAAPPPQAQPIVPAVAPASAPPPVLLDKPAMPTL